MIVRISCIQRRPPGADSELLGYIAYDAVFAEGALGLAFDLVYDYSDRDKAG